jgi:hypothetical protein
MALLTLGVIFSLGIRRFAATRRREVSVKYYRTFTGEGGEPESLRQHTRHALNHFEIPPLFHFAVWGTFALSAVTPAAVGAAWLFVASRGVHSAIHLTYNNVLHRFLVYGAGLIIVAFLWLRLLLALTARVV